MVEDEFLDELRGLQQGIGLLGVLGEVLVGISEKAGVDSVEAEERLPVVALLPPELQERPGGVAGGRNEVQGRVGVDQRGGRLKLREVVDDLAEPFAVGVFGIGLEVGAAGIKGLGALVGKTTRPGSGR